MAMRAITTEENTTKIRALVFLQRLRTSIVTEFSPKEKNVPNICYRSLTTSCHVTWLFN